MVDKSYFVPRYASESEAGYLNDVLSIFVVCLMFLFDLMLLIMYYCIKSVSHGINSHVLTGKTHVLTKQITCC